MKKGVISVVLAVIASGAHAENKPTRFWNLTVNTITALQMSPAGKQEWGINQCKNDRDGTVDHDERLRITDVSAGRYDVRLVDKDGAHMHRARYRREGGRGLHHRGEAAH